jgi:membrane protein required for beta-lactamase induction
MNFIALLLGLAIERLLTNLFHLREFHWLDPWTDRMSKRLANASLPAAIIGTGIYAVIAILPVAFVAWLLSGTLLHIPYFLLAVIVLLFSLGPRDLLTEVNDYCAAVSDGRDEDVQRIVRELREGGAPQDADEQIAAVRRAIFIQANNRVFGVVFWFILFGPTGAWLFRVVDLLRHRLAFEYSREDQPAAPTAFIRAVRSLHGALAWPSAHLLILGYALAGSFEGGLTAWRGFTNRHAQDFFVTTNDLLDLVGNGAVSQQPVPDDTPVAVVRVSEAMSLVTRTLWLIWAPVMALLTLSGWLS